MDLPKKLLREREQRIAVNQRVEVLYGGEGCFVETLNVSLNGVCLIGIKQQPVGSPVTIHYRDLHINGRVAWSGGSVIGMEFLEPLSPENFRTLWDLE